MLLGKVEGRRRGRAVYVFELMLKTCAAKTYQWWTKIFHTDAAGTLGRPQEVLHQTVALDTEAERRAVGKLHDA